LRIDAVQFAGFDERSNAGPVLRPLIVAREQRVLSIENNLAVILPISGRMSSSIIAGIHCTGEARVVFKVSGAHQARSCTWSCRPAL
jgi:hypothetical protein